MDDLRRNLDVFEEIFVSIVSSVIKTGDALVERKRAAASGKQVASFRPVSILFALALTFF